MSDTAIPTPEPAWAAFVALDWGSQKHAWTLQSAGGGRRNKGFVDNTPEAIAVWAADLHRRRRPGTEARIGREPASPLRSPNAVPRARVHVGLLPQDLRPLRRQRRSQ